MQELIYVVTLMNFFIRLILFSFFSIFCIKVRKYSSALLVLGWFQALLSSFFYILYLSTEDPLFLSMKATFEIIAVLTLISGLREFFYKINRKIYVIVQLTISFTLIATYMLFQDAEFILITTTCMTMFSVIVIFIDTIQKKKYYSKLSSYDYIFALLLFMNMFIVGLLQGYSAIISKIYYYAEISVGTLIVFYSLFYVVMEQSLAETKKDSLKDNFAHDITNMNHMVLLSLGHAMNINSNDDCRKPLIKAMVEIEKANVLLEEIRKI